MRKLLLAGAALLALAGTPAEAQEQPLPGADAKGCLAWPAAMAAAQMHNPDASLVEIFEGPLALELIEVVNKVPPQSQFDGDHAALFFKRDVDQFLVVIGERDCARTVVELPASIFAHMVGQPV